jgi:hypothetical protein
LPVARYRKPGVASMIIDALEITPLDGLHAMARVMWIRATAAVAWSAFALRTNAP